MAAFLLLLGTAFAAVRWDEVSGYTFERFVHDFQRSYVRGSEEWLNRKSIFENNLLDIATRNSNPKFTYKSTVNRFTDMTSEERRAFLGLAKPLLHAGSRNVSQVKRTDFPDSLDWRNKGVLTAVKDQGQCGSCWAFGSTATLESRAAIATGILQDLAVAQVVSCAPNPQKCGGWGGCAGSTAELAYRYLASTGGISAEWFWAYESYWGNTNGTCKTSGAPKVVKLDGYSNSESNSVESLMTAIQDGPVVVNVDASIWFTYGGGVFNGCNKDNIDIDHVVELVGYGTDDKLGPYWIIRNSWDTTWGEKGFIRLARTPPGQKPSCGIDKNPHDGTSCLPAPPNVTACGECGVLYDGVWPTGVSLA